MVTVAKSAPKSLGLLGKKIGMTRIFTEDGKSVPATIVDVSANRISQIKTTENEGYSAVQVAFGERRAHRLSKSVKGHLAKAGVNTAKKLLEFRVDEVADKKIGETLFATIFTVGQMVDVCGQSLGKGFAGVIKRHNFSSNRATHGNSVTTRAPGSIGMRQDPGRVFRGKRMAGHLGDVRVSVQNLEVLRVDENRQLLWIKGAVPGFEGAILRIQSAVRARAGKGGVKK